MGIVDRDKEEKILVEIEQIFQKNDLMADEKIFVINEVANRIKQGQEKQKMSDLMTNSLSGGLLKSITKKLFKSDEDEK